ncbi:putative enoyl-CoA hydratase/isomerase [Aeromicrobium flavum]|uniref:Putative enoyl-CoA hydratase/isomerase n=1 Tax=Aeromicrobium flavum TaxID=416568 RepID=A0A512HXU3_9ACTN|nr:enoyl-CoA hydratase-related protein [Aeromicrobium flavum]GEO90271.1 putative enoyl-CoA hydratase/isomerase [Aeromicrobium flavum]
MTELVHLDVAEGVATITLDSEHNRNALSRQLVTELGAHLESAEADADAKVIVLRSAHRVFCSGADLSEAAEGSMQQGAAALIDLQRRLATSVKPVVVVLGGPVRAGGLGLVGAADIVLATRPVTFALTEVRLALAPAVISLSLLPRLAPRAASELFLTGRKFDAAEAAEIGLVTRVVEDGELESALQAVLADLALGFAQGFRETKALLNHDLVERIDRLGPQLAEKSAQLFGSDEARDAMLAFLSRKG